MKGRAMDSDNTNNKKISERIETIVGEAKEVAAGAIRMSGNEVELSLIHI